MDWGEGEASALLDWRRETSAENASRPKRMIIAVTMWNLRYIYLLPTNFIVITAF